MVVSPDRKQLITRNQEFLQVWNAETLEGGITYGAKSEKWTDMLRSGPALTLAISPDGEHVVMTDDGTITNNEADAGSTELELENGQNLRADQRIVW